MKGDFSRLTFDKTKHYSGVRMQQGRVQLDADWNEQLDITAHRIESEISDFIGASGAPADSADADGPISNFLISEADKDKGGSKLAVGRGRYYIAGKLFENHEPQKIITPANGSLAAGIYIVYLDVWQQHITALEDPSIREVALGGPDTATRIRNQWQAAFQRVEAEDSEFKVPIEDVRVGQFKVRTSGGMKAELKPNSSIPENQLYRIEIHEGGSWDEAAFKWSRDNGSVAAKAARTGNTFTLDAPADFYTRFARDQWLEVTSAEQRASGELGSLYRITAVTGKTVTVDDSTDPLGSATTDLLIRRWDGKVNVHSAASIPLEHGIQVQFEPEKEYEPGDYWQFPARSITKNIEWPEDDSFQPPHGVQHAYVPLAMVHHDGSYWTATKDLRNKFQPLTTGLLSKRGDQELKGSLKISGELKAPAGGDEQHDHKSAPRLQVEESIHIERATLRSRLIRTYAFETDLPNEKPAGFGVKNSAEDPQKNWHVVTPGFDLPDGYKGNCLRSGKIGPSEWSHLSLDNVAIRGSGSIRFWFKVDTEAGFDFLEFEYGEVGSTEHTNLLKNSGPDEPWRQFDHPLEEGTYDFQWKYTKDHSGDEGGDAVWVGLIEIESEGGPHISVGDKQTGLYSLADKQLALVTDGKARLAVGRTGGLAINGSLEIAGELRASADGEKLVGLKVAPTFDNRNHYNVTHLGLQVGQSIHIERTSSTPPITKSYELEGVGLLPEGFRVENSAENPDNDWQVVSADVQGKNQLCFRSGPEGEGGLQDNQFNYLYLENVPISGKATISFLWKTESESYDKFKFRAYLAENPKKYDYSIEKSGETAWQNYYLHLPEEGGVWNFRWEYQKDASISTGKDDAWIANIVITSEAGPHISVGDRQTGLFSLGDSQLALVTGGKARLSVDNYGVKASLIQEDWIDVELNSSYGWQNQGTDFDNVAYFKDSQGIVHLKGAAIIPSDVAGDPTNKCKIFTLPPGYRPERLLALPVTTQTGIVRLFIHHLKKENIKTVSGEVNVNTDDIAHLVAGHWISFDGISFRAAE